MRFPQMYWRLAFYDFFGINYFYLGGLVKSMECGVIEN